MNRNFYYNGPKADIASITGSPLWGISVDEVKDHYCTKGWTCFYDQRPYTRYGQGPRTLGFDTSSGRQVLWIPSYGMIRGEDWKLHQTDQKLFSILKEAGVKILIVGGTSGIADWRSENKIQPGDVVLPWSFRTSAEHRGLAGTENESSWPHYDLTLDNPFCTDLAQELKFKFTPHSETGRIGKIHTPQDARVALVTPESITFETDYDILMWLAINKIISDMTPQEPPVVTLHGDCVNPILSRLLGIHIAYYHMVANVAQGLPMEESITESLYRLYLKNFPQVALDIEFRLMEEVELPSGNTCSCIKSLHTAPEVFNQAMTT